MSFQNTLEAFARELDALPARDETVHLLDKIKDFISDQNNEEFLRLEFDRSKALAWISVMYFYCRPLRLYLEVGADVSGGLIDERTLCPEFELGGVQERLPKSPIAFLWKFYGEDYQTPDDTLEIPMEARSLWVFSWLASSGQAEGDYNAS